MKIKDEFWDIGEHWTQSKLPNLSITSLAKVMRALILLKGKMLSSIVFGGNDIKDRYRDVVYRIFLPVGSRGQFEEMTGYTLTKPKKVHVN
jgi:hypothetical protein